MRKKILVYGTIAGLICIAWPLSLMSLGTKIDFENGELYGYLTMLLAFSLIVVGVKNIRDNQLNGVISFGKAFRSGFLISVVASTVYVVIWLVYYYTSGTDFIEQYTAHLLQELKAAGASEQLIAQQVREMKEFGELYQNPFFNALITYMEILPVGLLVSLITAFIMRRKPKTPPGEALDSHLVNAE